ncbi:hypothetical protein DYE50_03485 [Treponema ruminis]|uniref:Bacterial repeat domain-containing protein n=1 Tax=Treponema ruminis TaxID=744515 RepID=A0A7W8G7V9_9SPIR|nr:Ig-like domain-containing protein [Treponema ruminis]MBB5225489.1 hypothetical protein [Treponema ruminis]QSI01641.1 hypothetical protein DYE50_03485 [Treponema ruminis]
MKKSCITKKILRTFKSLLCFTILGGGTFFSFVSCENFLDNGDFKEQLDKDIAYAKAKSLSIIISPEVGTGASIPDGKYTVKQGYPFEVSFTEASGYSFVKWIAVSNEDSKKEIEGVVFDNEASPKTMATVNIDSDDVRILPLCSDRIAVVGEPNPKYEANGVSRDRSITVQFSKKPDPKSFIFSKGEIPDGAETIASKKTDSETGEETEEIWAYVYENQTFLKNISITNADGISLAEHFNQPVLEDNLLTVSVNKSKPIEFESGVEKKAVIVTLSTGICDQNGVSMSAEKTWRYQITEATDEKATVNISCEVAEGSLHLSGTKDYSIGQKINLSFTENADYQFVRWDYDKSIIYVADQKSNSTTATVLEKTGSTEPTQIKALCAPRLRVSAFSPINDSLNPSVSKNSSIIITFDQNLPDDEEGLAQLENIMITLGGSPVHASFLEPVISGNTVTFAADKSNMLDVASGQTKKISVTVPTDFYYILDDGTKVTYGGIGKTFNYTIDETTIDKAEVTFAAAKNSGSLTPAAGSANKYSVGQEVPISFELAQGWQFNGWSVTLGNTEVGEDKIKILDKKSLSTKLIVNEAVQGITVTAKASESLKVASTTPAEKTNPKDSDITITFNKPLASECEALLDKIKVTMDGYNVDSFFDNESRTLSDKTIILKNTKYLDLSASDKKTVTVTIPASFYYNDGTEKAYMQEDYVFNYEITSETTAKSGIKYSLSSENGGKIFINQESVYLDRNIDYDIGSVLDLELSIYDGYQFNGWEIYGSDVYDTDLKIADRKALSTKLYIYKPVSYVTIAASISLKPAVLSVSPGEGTHTANTPVKVTFNMPMNKQNVLDNLLILYTDSAKNNKDMSEYFETPSFDSAGKILTLVPKANDLKNFAKNMAYIDISVSFGDGVKVSNLPLVQNSKSTFKVRYKPEVENTAPKKYDFFATTKYSEISKVSGIKDTEKFSLDSLNSFSDDQILQNRTQGTVYIYGRYFDEESGVKFVNITEQRTNDKKGSVVNEDVSDAVPYSADSHDAQFVNDGTGYTDFRIKYDIQSDDGAILLTVNVADACGNTDESENQTVIAIKDSYIDLTDLNVENTTNDLTTIWFTQIGHPFVNDAPYGRWINLKKIVYRNCEIDSSKLTVNCEYIDDEGTERVVDFDFNDSFQYYDNYYKSDRIDYKWSLVLENIEDVSNKSFTVKVTDDIGNVSAKKFTFPPTPVLLSITPYYYNGAPYSGYVDFTFSHDYLKNSSETDKYHFRLLYNYNDNDRDSAYSDSYIPCEFEHIDYQVHITKSTRSNSYGLNSKGINFKSELTDSELEPVGIKYIEYSKSRDDYVKITVHIDYDSWNKYDLIYIDDNLFFESGTYSCSYEVLTRYLYDPAKIDSYAAKTITGEKDGKISPRTKLPITVPNSDLYDNSKPVFLDSVGGPDNYDYFNVIKNKFGTSTEIFDYMLFGYSVKDYESGVKKCILQNNSAESSYELDSSLYDASTHYVYLPRWDLDDNVSYELKVVDKAGNENSHSPGRYAFMEVPPEITRFDILYMEMSYPNTSYSQAYRWQYYLYSFEDSDSDGIGTWEQKKVGDLKGYYSTQYSAYMPLQNCEAQGFYMMVCYGFYQASYGTDHGRYDFSIPRYYYYYKGTDNKYVQNTGNYDLILANGSSKDSVAISSDAPVFVQTLTTKYSYEECKSWDINKWQRNRRHIGEKVMSFDSTDHAAKKYKIPVNEIDEGDCYVVIAHFADGTSSMSEVKQK